MSRKLQDLHRYVVVLETALAGGLTAMVFVVVFSQVLMRYLFAQPSPWSEELSRFCLVWMAMMGAAIAVSRGSHFAFEAFVERLAAPTRQALAAVAWVALVLVALLLVAGGLLLVELTMGQRSPALGVSVAWVYAAVPSSGALMLFHLLARQTLRPDGDR